MHVSSFRQASHRLTLLALALILALAGMIAADPPAARAAVGGPVILGGDDLTDHGSYDGTNNQDGWLYIEKAIANIKPQVTRAGADGSIAALGSNDPSFDPTAPASFDAGEAIASAAAKNGMPVNYYAGDAAINGFFDALRAGTVKPSIIWIAGDGAGNDLGSNGGSAALSANATTIGDFVNTGGGLMSHGVEYGWLGGVLPGVTMDEAGGSGDLVLTPQGLAAFPGLTNDDVNAGPWHGHFEGDIGGLQVLVTSSGVNDSQGNDARVVIGGAAVTLPGTISLAPATATNPVGTSHTVTATVRNPDGSPRPGVAVAFSVTSGPGSGTTGNGTTNATGKATFTYTNNGTTGTDTIQASYTENQVPFSATATKTWVAGTTVVRRSATGQGRTVCRVSGSARTSGCWNFRFNVTKSSGVVRGSAVVRSPRGKFVSRKMTALSVSGDVATFKGSGTWRGKGGHVLRARVVDGSPDLVRFAVHRKSRLKAKVAKAVRYGYVTVKP